MRLRFDFSIAAVGFAACLGCGGPANVAESPDSSATQAEPIEATNPAPDPTPREVSGEISNSDLTLAQEPRRQTEAEPATNLATSLASGVSPRILEEAHEIVQRYDDESIQRRWTVRLYVNFDRSKPWHQQSPGSWIEHGPYEEFYPGGKQRLMQGEFREGKRHGEWKYWHEKGEVAKEGAYDNAQLDGPWRYYRKDGTLLRTESYRTHRKHGLWRFYDTDGKTVFREEMYRDDEAVTSNDSNN